ncbi:hypothetical protein U2261_08870 [Achromobacter xylosoxidans]|uniref:hypothetical protein n=1 Tax=Alcaligenes xylosoxydans xylosoxydans TaxID=85698 RepID=UPI0006C0A360|nr:hypothetical protein [Achromobacter xylosoxidans]MBK1980744.1 hypothetical protein [Achromobacter xylosoxidans]MCH4582379.1 hypothetical protein [Achromobacter xylosoxidans]MCZ8383562.1 hypothetical protein [Achromobacter xylosoxidans]MDZ5614714.1 hypothetical protein [Achromobacter xylosoxidans]MDZ5627416.1 hypothetical protein [Achromobacter xylosoxidans]
MDVALGARMGGPEAGSRFLPAVVAYRPRLKAALAPVVVPGAATLDIELFVGGSISDYAESGFSAVAKYSGKKAALAVAIQVPRHDAMAVADADANAAVASWVVRGLESMKRSASAGALDLTGVLAALKRA